MTVFTTVIPPTAKVKVGCQVFTICFIFMRLSSTRFTFKYTGFFSTSGSTFHKARKLIDLHFALWSIMCP